VADVALVCGAGGALGSAIVGTLRERGDAVVAVDRHAEGEAVEGVRREAVDLTSPDEVASLWSRLAGDGVAPRWVVNAVGGYRSGSVADTEPDRSSRNIGSFDIARAQ